MNTLQNRWSPEDQQILIAGYKLGTRCKTIARELGRTPNAIISKAKELRLIKRRPQPLPAVTSVAREPERLTITKDQLPAFYALGWRVDWFEAGQVGVEWGGRGEAVRV